MRAVVEKDPARAVPITPEDDLVVKDGACFVRWKGGTRWERAGSLVGSTLTDPGITYIAKALTSSDPSEVLISLQASPESFTPPYDS